MTDQHQTEAQRLAALLRSRNNNQAGFGLGPVCDEAAVELLRLNSVHADLERVSMQLVACGVVAMADTPDQAKEARTMHPDYESASCDDVKRRVDECIELRARVAELEEILATLPISSLTRLRTRIKQLEEMLAAVGAGGVGLLVSTAVQHQHDFGGKNDLQRKADDSVTSCSTTAADWKLVPVVPTREMIEAGKDAHYEAEKRIQEPDAWSPGGFAKRAVRATHVFQAMLAAAPQPPKHYDQQALDLCMTCGWKTMIPGDCCLNCARQKPQVEQDPVASLADAIRAEPTELIRKWRVLELIKDHTHPQPKPLTDEAVLGVAKSIEIQFDSERLNEQIDDILAFARAIEAAHNIK